MASSACIWASNMYLPLCTMILKGLFHLAALDCTVQEYASVCVDVRDTDVVLLSTITANSNCSRKICGYGIQAFGS